MSRRQLALIAVALAAAAVLFVLLRPRSGALRPMVTVTASPLPPPLPFPTTLPSGVKPSHAHPKFTATPLPPELLPLYQGTDGERGQIQVNIGKQGLQCSFWPQLTRVGSGWRFTVWSSDRQDYLVLEADGWQRQGYTFRLSGRMGDRAIRVNEGNLLLTVSDNQALGGTFQADAPAITVTAPAQAPLAPEPTGPYYGMDGSPLPPGVRPSVGPRTAETPPPVSWSGALSGSFHVQLR